MYISGTWFKNSMKLAFMNHDVTLSNVDASKHAKVSAHFHIQPKTLLKSREAQKPCCNWLIRNSQKWVAIIWANIKKKKNKEKTRWSLFSFWIIFKKVIVLIVIIYWLWYIFLVIWLRHLNCELLFWTRWIIIKLFWKSDLIKVHVF